MESATAARHALATTQGMAASVRWGRSDRGGRSAPSHVVVLPCIDRIVSGCPEGPRRYGRAVIERLPPPAAQPGRAAAPGTVSALVAAAADGDQVAWDSLVSRYGGLVWSIARSHRLGPADAADVSQTVWLRLVEHLRSLRDPEHVGGWLATTTRHECLRVIRRAGRELPDEDAAMEVPISPEQSPEWLVLSDESRRLVWLALGRLSIRCQTLLRALSAAPDASYAEIAAALEMPIGSIGPTRMRCLEHLRRTLVSDGAMSESGEW
jgi:RNA polymerase sigma factor (sigma-70 family)